MGRAVRAFFRDGSKVLAAALAAFLILFIVDLIIAVLAVVSGEAIGAADVVWAAAYFLSILLAAGAIMRFGRDNERHEYIISAALICLLVIFMPTYLHTMYRRTGSYVLNPYNTIPAVFMLFGGLLNYREYRREEKVLADFAGRYDASFYPEDSALGWFLGIWGGLRAIACEARECIARAGGGSEEPTAAPAQSTLGRYADGLRKSVREDDGQERRQHRKEVAARTISRIGATASIIWTLLIRFLKWFFTDGSKFLIVPLVLFITFIVSNIRYFSFIIRVFGFVLPLPQSTMLTVFGISINLAAAIIIRYRNRIDKYGYIIIAGGQYLITNALISIIAMSTGTGLSSLSSTNIMLTALTLLGGFLNYLAYRRMAYETLNCHLSETPSPPSPAPLGNHLQ